MAIGLGGRRLAAPSEKGERDERRHMCRCTIYPSGHTCRGGACLHVVHQTSADSQNHRMGASEVPNSCVRGDGTKERSSIAHGPALAERGSGAARFVCWFSAMAYRGVHCLRRGIEPRVWSAHETSVLAPPCQLPRQATGRGAWRRERASGGSLRSARRRRLGRAPGPSMWSPANATKPTRDLCCQGEGGILCTPGCSLPPGARQRNGSWDAPA